MIERVIKIDASTKTGEIVQFWNRMVGCGHAYLLTRTDLFEHVDDAFGTLGFEYIRFHGILGDDVGLLQYAHVSDKEIDDDCLNFTNVDLIFDNLVERIGIKPCVELSFMPKYIASGTVEVFRYPSNITPPASYSLWASLVGKLVAHWKDRYGIDGLLDWYFEVWNEPDLHSFWSGTKDEYFTLYDHAARAIKAVDPRLKVGGPASSGGRWIADFLAHCKDAGSPVDFVSTHAYGADAPLNGEKLANGSVVLQNVSRARKDIQNSSFPSLPLVITEWGSTSSPFSELHDTSNQAAFICKTVFEVNGLVDAFSYWTVSDVFEEQGMPDREFHGGFGLCTLHGIKKPAFIAFQYLNQLGPDLVGLEVDGGLPPGVGVVATVKPGKHPDLAILAWYFVDPGEKGAARGPAGVTFEVNVAPFDDADLDFEVTKVGPSTCNAYHAWKQMGSPRTPTPEQIDELDVSTELEHVIGEIIAERSGSTFKLSLEIEPASVMLVRIFEA